MLTYEIPLLLSVNPCQVYCTLALDVSDHLGHRIFRRDCDHHMHMIRQQMSFLDLALFLGCQLAEYLPKMLSQLQIQRLSPAPGNEYDVVYAEFRNMQSSGPACRKVRQVDPIYTA